MKRLLVRCIILSLFVSGSWLCFNGENKAANMPAQNLSDFDGTKKNIYGPLGMQIPESYFIRDLSASEESTSYNAVVEIDVVNPVLVLETPSEESNGIPIIVSLVKPGSTCKNYILNFGEEGVLKIDLEEELNSVKTKALQTIVLRVKSDFIFFGKVYNGDAVVKELEVVEPVKKDALGKGFTIPVSDQFLCSPYTYSTSNPSGKIRVRLVAQHNSSSVYAWVKITQTRTDSGSGWGSSYYESKYDNELSCYYPTESDSDIIHMGTVIETRWVCSPGNYCTTGLNRVFETTSKQIYGNYGPARHSWTNMANVVLASPIQTGTVTTENEEPHPGHGNSWTIYRQ
ncbi:MAG: hypothetical protein GY754_40135 [bacterium]|nr:hypothetical protein [bacterium]